ncbi:hypothetical protein Acsp05_56970 [Actinokineospora sp. NBRC 105648]|nr:hypothetical protein Acsp05_56970 [Actinokineospora sp. NBRC 105648]
MGLSHPDDWGVDMRLRAFVFSAVLAVGALLSAVPAGADVRESPVPGVRYEVVVQSSDKCLDVSGANPDNGAQVIQWSCHGGPNQRWWLTSVGGGNYQVQVEHSDKCLDVSGASPSNGARVIQWSCHGGPNQRWRLVASGPDVYQVRVAHSDKCLDVSGASPSNGANVIQWDCHGGPNQRWRFRRP